MRRAQATRIMRDLFGGAQHPVQIAAAKDMHMKMRHFLHAVLAGVGNRAVAIPALTGADIFEAADLADGAGRT